MGKPVPEQVAAFCDTWAMDAAKQELGKAMPALLRDRGIQNDYVELWRLGMQARRQTQPHLLAYLAVAINMNGQGCMMFGNFHEQDASNFMLTGCYPGLRRGKSYDETSTWLQIQGGHQET